MFSYGWENIEPIMTLDASTWTWNFLDLSRNLNMGASTNIIFCNSKYLSHSWLQWNSTYFFNSFSIGKVMSE
jgi:hypothetical protein